jgi:hypothetical protein
MYICFKKYIALLQYLMLLGGLVALWPTLLQYLGTSNVLVKYDSSEYVQIPDIYAITHTGSGYSCITGRT